MASANKKHLVVAAISSISLKGRGATSVRGATRHTLSSTLLWPRTGVQSKTWTRVVELPADSHTFDGAGWDTSVLFKDTLQAPCAVRFQMTAPLTSAILKKMLGAIAKAALKLTADEVEDGVPVLGDVLAAPIDAVAATVASGTDRLLAEGCLEFLSESDLAENGTREVALLAPRDIVRETSAGSSAGHGAARARRRVTVFKKGEKIGSLVLSLQIVE